MKQKVITMVEIRWVKDNQGFMQLQQRTRGICRDASGAFCELTEWSEWQAVPIVHDPHEFVNVVDVFDTRSSR